MKLILNKNVKISKKCGKFVQMLQMHIYFFQIVANATSFMENKKFFGIRKYILTPRVLSFFFVLLLSCPIDCEQLEYYYNKISNLRVF